MSYATVLGDEWVVLTNARQWRLYHTFAQTPLAGKLVMSLDLTAWDTDAEFDRLFDQLWLVSKESFLAGEGPNAWLTSQKLDHHLRHSMLDASSAEVKYIRKQLEAQGISVGVEDVVTWFKGHLVEHPTPTVAAEYPKPGIDAATRKVATPVADFPAIAVSATPPPTYWIVPSGKQGGYTAAEHLRSWLDRGFWGFGASTPGRKAMKPGDWACFYAAASHRVLAVGRVAGRLDDLVKRDEWPGPGPFNDAVYKVPLAEITWMDPAREIDAELRSHMDAFSGKAPTAGWSWLVQTTHRVTRADFERLTGTTEK